MSERNLYNQRPENIMNDTLPKMHVCESCGFMSTRGNEFEMVAGEKLCLCCADKKTTIAHHDRSMANEQICKPLPWPSRLY
jgi:hypothetical protein